MIYVNTRIAQEVEVVNNTPIEVNQPKGVVSSSNTSIGTLSSLATFTGASDEVLPYAGVKIAMYASQDCYLYLEFSVDGVSNWRTLPAISVDANKNEVHVLAVTRPYFRVRLENRTTSTCNYELYTIKGDYTLLTNRLNQTIQQDADAILTKSIGDELLIAGGYVEGISIVNKFGANADIDTGSVPEDITEIGGVYTGFPDTTLETISLSSTSLLDTSAGTGARSVRISGLDTNYNVQSETITLNGLIPVASVNQYRRLHTMTVQSVGSLGVNQGTITATHTTTVSNVFCSIQIGRNQSNMSGYTIPAGYTGYMRFLHSAIIQGTASANAQGAIWTRSFGAPFRSRRPFLISTNYRLEDKIFGGLVFTEKSDLILRITNVSNNNTVANGGYDLILIKN